MPGSDSHERYTFAGFRLEPSRRLLIDAQGAPVKLTAKAFDALVYLVEHAGDLVDRSHVDRDSLAPRVVEDNNLNQAIAALRRAIGSGHVVTVAGRGYQFVTPVRVAPADVGTSAPAMPNDRVPRPERASARHLHARARRGRGAACDGCDRSIRPRPSLRHGRHRARRGRPNRARDHVSRRRRDSRSVARRLAGSVFMGYAVRPQRHLRAAGEHGRAARADESSRGPRLQPGLVSRR